MGLTGLRDQSVGKAIIFLETLRGCFHSLAHRPLPPSSKATTPSQVLFTLHLSDSSVFTFLSDQSQNFKDLIRLDSFR